MSISRSSRMSGDPYLVRITAFKVSSKNDYRKKENYLIIGSKASPLDVLSVSSIGYTFALRRRSALPITETELKLIAAAAMIGLSNRPVNG